MENTRELKERQELKDRPVATINLQELPVEELVDLAAAKKDQGGFCQGGAGCDQRGDPEQGGCFPGGPAYQVYGMGGKREGTGICGRGAEILTS